IARTAVAEPTSSESHVLIFGDREFTARLADVLPIRIGIARQPRRRDDAPPSTLEHLLINLIVSAEGELEGLRGAPRQVDEFQELKMLAPVVDLSEEFHLAILLLPVANCREALRAGVFERLPEIHDDRLTGRSKVKLVRRGQLAIGRTVV